MHTSGLLHTLIGRLHGFHEEAIRAISSREQCHLTRPVSIFQ